VVSQRKEGVAFRGSGVTCKTWLATPSRVLEELGEATSTGLRPEVDLGHVLLFGCYPDGEEEWIPNTMGN
jgi:hypothetical protein